MINISNWSKLGYMFGATFSLASIVRYYVMFPDLDRAFVYGLIGLIICGLAFLYNHQLEQDKSILSMEDYLSELNLKGGQKIT